MARAKHLVRLTCEQREQLHTLIRTGNAAAHIQRHARILLKADCNAEETACDDLTIANAVEVSRASVERVRRAFATGGLDAALNRKTWTGRSRRKLDGVQEAQLAQLACSPPPAGAERWTLSLLADKLVELKIVDSIACDTVRVVLKKTRLSLG